MKLQVIDFTTFDDLPPELRQQIWRNIDRTELQVMRRVSKLWDLEIKTHFGISIVISQESWPYWQQVRVGPGIIHIHFYSFTTRFSPSIFTAQIRSLSLSKILLKNNLICILQHFGNTIEELYFSKVVLDQDSQIYSPYPINLPKLRTLEIHAALDSEGDGISAHDELILCFMGQANYGVLKNFYFSCPNFILSGFHLNYLFNGSLGKSDWLVELVDKNRHTLRQLRLGSEINSFVFTLRERIDTSSNIIPIQMESIQATDTLPRSWDLLIRNQHGLRSLQLESNGFEQWDAAYNSIRQSEESIEVVSMSGSGGEFTAIDMSCFTNCRWLFCLKLHFQVYRIDNLQNLPVSLRILSLYGPLSKFQICTLIGKLVNLQEFTLDNQETANDGINSRISNYTSVDQQFLGSTIDVRLLRHFVLMPNLKFLFLKNCTMNYRGVKSWFESESSFECKMRVNMKPLNESGTLGCIRAEIELGSKTRLPNLDPRLRPSTSQ